MLCFYICLFYVSIYADTITTFKFEYKKAFSDGNSLANSWSETPNDASATKHNKTSYKLCQQQNKIQTVNAEKVSGLQNVEYRLTD